MTSKNAAASADHQTAEWKEYGNTLFPFDVDGCIFMHACVCLCWSNHGTVGAGNVVASEGDCCRSSVAVVERHQVHLLDCKGLLLKSSPQAIPGRKRQACRLLQGVSVLRFIHERFITAIARTPLSHTTLLCEQLCDVLLPTSLRRRLSATGTVHSKQAKAAQNMLLSLAFTLFLQPRTDYLRLLIRRSDARCDCKQREKPDQGLAQVYPVQDCWAAHFDCASLICSQT